MVKKNKKDDQILALAERMFIYFDHVDERFDMLGERMEALEVMLQRLFWFIEFHLGEIPQKYRKFNTEKNEYPYFKTKQNYKINGFNEPDFPKNPEEMRESAMKMKYYAAQQKSIDDERKKKVNDEMLRRATSAAFSDSSEQQDSVPENKPDEPSPFSQESPDHKNPPCQT